MELPVSFTEYTRSLMGEEEYARLAAALGEEQPVTIRLNEEKLSPSSFSLLYARYLQIPWCKEGIYLDRRLTFTFDPLFHAGCYYVQEASSMFVAHALRQYFSVRSPLSQSVLQEPIMQSPAISSVSGQVLASGTPVVALDLCAAPGGKSTLMRSVLPEGSLLVANEVMRNRCQVLAENLTKWGNAGVVVTNNDPADFTSLTDCFDVILSDVPCSGEGMFRKDPVAVAEWSPENVEICWQRQRRIITDIWPCLKSGGLLLYSTCTFNTKEDEENVQWICDELGAEVLPVDIAEEWNITGNLLEGTDFPVYRFLPHRTQGEGFFLAVLRKKGESSTASDDNYKPLKSSDAFTAKSERESFYKKGKAKQKAAYSKPKSATAAVTKEQLEVVCHWLQSSDAYEWTVAGASITAFPRVFSSLLSRLQQTLRVVNAGISIAEVKGQNLIPAHALAMSVDLRREAFTSMEVNYTEAIAYLRKEAIAFPSDTPVGYLLLTFHNVPLGFVKNVGNRANNLYPQEWRIRSTYLPENIQTLPI